MRVMVTGSREWTDEQAIRDALDALEEEETVTAILHGCAAGADTMAAMWAMDHGVPAIGIPAQWSFYGRGRAGPIRNGWLLDENPDLVVAFPMPSSRGTWDAVRQAMDRGIPVRIHGKGTA